MSVDNQYKKKHYGAIDVTYYAVIDVSGAHFGESAVRSVPVRWNKMQESSQAYTRTLTHIHRLFFFKKKLDIKLDLHRLERRHVIVQPVYQACAINVLVRMSSSVKSLHGS